MNKDSYGITYYQDITFVSSVPLLFLFFKLIAPGIPRWPLIQVPPRPIPAYPRRSEDIRCGLLNLKVIILVKMLCITYLFPHLDMYVASSYLLAYAICMSWMWRSSENSTELLTILYI